MCESEYVLFVAFQLDEENDTPVSLRITPNRDEIDKWKNDQRKAKKGEDKNVEENEQEHAETENIEGDKISPSEELSDLMIQIQETISSYRFLTMIGSGLLPIARSVFIERRIFKRSNDELDRIEVDNEFVIFGVSADKHKILDQYISRLREFDKGGIVLPGAILLSLVATFDSYISNTLRIMLRNRSELVVDNSKTIAVRDLMKMGSFEEVIDKVIEDEVSTLMRGSHDDQISYIESKLGVKIRDNYDSWSEFIEIFERRNLVAHGNCVVNRYYIDNCKKHGVDIDNFKIGEILPLDPDYLRGSADYLLEFGLSLTFILWLKHFKDDAEGAFEKLSYIAYELIRDQQEHIASNLLELALYKQKFQASDRVRKVMTINLSNAYKKLKDDQKSKNTIETVDWSAATNDFKICIASLRGDVDKFVELMPIVVRDESITKQEFRVWPVFDWVRDETAVQEKFEEMFSEPLIYQALEKEDDGASTGVEMNPQDETMH